jgi:hypothetical protein
MSEPLSQLCRNGIGLGIATRSVDMNLARPLEAGVKEMFLNLRRVSDDCTFNRR